jgi:hypothetical protein
MNGRPTWRFLVRRVRRLLSSAAGTRPTRRPPLAVTAPVVVAAPVASVHAACMLVTGVLGVYGLDFVVVAGVLMTLILAAVAGILSGVSLVMTAAAAE